MRWAQDVVLGVALWGNGFAAGSLFTIWRLKKARRRSTPRPDVDNGVIR